MTRKKYDTKGMTREGVLKTLYSIALQLSKQYDYELNDRMWGLCYDWNSTHGEREEIFMCEDEDESGEFRYFIEDDYFYLGE